MFDEPNLVSVAGLVPVLRLAEAAGFYDLLSGVSVPAPNPVSKTACLVAGLLAGADSIDDLDLLRHGGMARVFTGVRAPSTLGTFLRSFTIGNVPQLGKVNAGLLAGLARLLPGLLAGGDKLAFLDLDDTIREVHGHHKQAAAFGYTRQRGLNIQLATVSTPLVAPVICAAQLRRGNAGSSSGCGRRLAEALTTARAAGVTGQVLVRADSAYYKWSFVNVALRRGVWFSVTAKHDVRVHRAIATIDPTAWTPIKYPEAVFDEAEQRWISDAEVAEVPFVAFMSRSWRHVSCRLVVRRVKRLQPRAGRDGSTQDELLAGYRYHAFITNSPLDTVAADAHHRGHAIIEQVIAELKDGPLAHLPSGKYTANAAWLACTVIAFNLARAASVAADMPTARWASLRRKLLHVPARIAATSRQLHLHLPTRWPWATSWQALWHTATGPPTTTLA